MDKRALITGGAGFIGSHAADRLVEQGYEVRVLDALVPQVHGPDAGRPTYLHPEVELVLGDVRDPDAVERALEGVEVVLHLTAAVGVGQSMYELAQYTSTNNLGTAVLLEQLMKRSVRRLVVASSMSLYGEGLYVDAAGRAHDDVERSLVQLEEHDWEPRGEDGDHLRPLATPETKPPRLSSIYALSKYDQEQMCRIFGRAYDVPVVALRFFNVYGPRQALSNPYTGVLAIFASRLLNGKPPLVFEDGAQRRDFVSVEDVARACQLALESDARDAVYNVGSGHAHTVREIAERVASAMGRPDIEPRITGDYRMGDIRHCFADVSRARRDLGFEAKVSLNEGLEELAGWLREQKAEDRTEGARRELRERGLTL